MVAYTVDVVHEALAVLMLVANSPGLGVTELAKRSGNTKARTFRLLSTMEQSGFVRQGPNNTNYSLGPTALMLGLAAQEQVGLESIAQPYLAELGERFNENVQIRVRDGNHTISIAKWDSTRSVRVFTELGARRPLHVGASGKVLLAFAPAALQASVLSGPLERFTPQTLVQRTKLTREFARIRIDGHAVSHGEMVNDVVAVAVPVFDARNAAVAALGISMPGSRAPEDLQPFAQALKATAEQISRELGWRPTAAG